MAALSASPKRPSSFRRRAATLVTGVVLGLASATAAYADPALWAVKGPTSTVYLFGTLHVLPAGVEWRSPSVNRALNASQEVWTEADPPALPYLARLIRRYGLSEHNALSDVLPKHYRSRYDMEMSSAGLRALHYDYVKPWLAERLLTDGSLHPRTGKHNVEAELLDYASHHDEARQTFESADNQFAILADLPIEAQIRALEIQLDAYPPNGSEMNTLVHAWMTGDEATLDKMSNQELFATDERYFNDVIVRRNERFAQDIATRLEDGGTAFVALGASHLVGTTSVQSFLRNYGYTATRVPDEAAPIASASIKKTRHAHIRHS
jgi:uncharacterized protein YbaP (TraB family)